MERERSQGYKRKRLNGNSDYVLDSASCQSCHDDSSIGKDNSLVARRRSSNRYRSSIPPPMPPVVELKYFDFDFTWDSSHSSPTVWQIAHNGDGNPEAAPLNVIPKGTDYFNRIGRVIRMTSINMNIYWKPKDVSGASESGGVLRWLVVYDRQLNDNEVTTDDVLTTASDGTCHLNFPDPDNRRRFTILKDKLSLWPQYTANLASMSFPPNLVQKFYKTCNLEAIYPDYTGTPITGGLYMVALSDDTAQILGTVKCRITFIDC